MSDLAEEFDFIVVGSGAGGGPLAANLARQRKYRVLLLEAGGDKTGFTYQVPGFHGLASEDPDLSWSYWVEHYDDQTQRAKDSKYIGKEPGVLYPRSGTLGGCTAHNAMITILPHDSDWDAIAELTGDSSWAARHMHRYFQRLEHCDYVAGPGEPPKNILDRVARLFGWLGALGRPASNPSGHGYRGWLHTQLADPTLAVPDRGLLRLLWWAILGSVARGVEVAPLKLLFSVLRFGVRRFDPNDVRERSSPEGITFAPLATREGKRNGTREYLLETTREFPEYLVVRTNCLVTRVLLNDATPRRATGVEYLEGAHLYGSASQVQGSRAEPRQARARHDVILAAGAFNSPQLLKLSGIGPREELERLQIRVAVDLPGVGENLQDRYEVGVVSEMNEDFAILGQATFAPPAAGKPHEPAFADWMKGSGLYTSNGVVLGIMFRSTRRAAEPDLFVFGLPGYFKGYYPDYSKSLLNKRNHFTWAVLKAHTANRGGRVTLKSSDPREPPSICFRYFEEGTDADGEDLNGVVEGVLFARGVMQSLGRRVKDELVPGHAVKSREQIADFVRNEAWGHHASCSNRMGPRSDPYAVVDSRFRVHGVRGLRVVDASVFPRIPGFFIVSAVYMISEKASDVILHDADLSS